jgi:hypothetical protein
MKKLLWIISLLTILSGCKKEGGKLICTMKYNLSNEKKTEHNTKSYTEVKSEHYTQFGDFITSITPDRFIGKFLHLNLSNKFLDEWECGIDFFDNHLEISDLRRLADFSNNATVSFIPEDVNIRKDAYLHYFMAVCLYWYQEFELPKEYDNPNLPFLQYLNFEGSSVVDFSGQAIGSERIGEWVKAGHYDLIAPIFVQNWTGFNGNYPVTAHNYFFGNTDSTFVFYSDPNDYLCTIHNPMGQPGYIIRSNKYQPTTIQRIPEGETRTIKGTMSFNTTDLIQIYAGADNIPFTSDDIFVYAPRFWERISVTLEYY